MCDSLEALLADESADLGLSNGVHILHETFTATQ